MKFLVLSTVPIDALHMYNYLFFKVQQKAIFRSLMAEKYCLLRGMPGSGKSTTIVGLIR